jgi:hypothetical protein
MRAAMAKEQVHAHFTVKPKMSLFQDLFMELAVTGEEDQDPEGWRALERILGLIIIWPGNFFRGDMKIEKQMVTHIAMDWIFGYIFQTGTQ